MGANSDSHDYQRYIGLSSGPIAACLPLERDPLRRFAHAIMDSDPLYYDEAYAGNTRMGGVVAPPLYPVHAVRRAPGTPDPLEELHRDPDGDGTAGAESMYFGLPPIETPFKRLLNGGNEIEFYRLLKLGEKVLVTARYADVSVKKGRSGEMLLVVIETEYRTEADELLLINRQTLIWR
jgi:hypothetical protein